MDAGPSRFESPNTWLRKALRRKGVSANAAARHLSLSSSQLSHWVNEHEKIPRRHLWELAELLDLTDPEHALELKAWEEMTERLRDTARTACGDDEGLAELVLRSVYGKLDALLAQQAAVQPTDRVSSGVRFLLAAELALRGVALLNDPAQPFISRDNVLRHVRYPMNHFVGLLLDLGADPDVVRRHGPVLAEFRARALRSLRRTAADSRRTSAGTAFVEDHSKHMLARHGDAADQERIKQTIVLGTAADDPMTRRLAYAGLALTQADPDVTQRYLRDVRHDDELRQANITFDAIHYGDIDLAHGDRIRGRLAAAPLNAIRHIARHVVNAEQYHAIQPIEEQTLCDIYALFGPSAFRDPGVRVLLEQCLISGGGAHAPRGFTDTVAEVVRTTAPPGRKHLTYR